MSNIAIRVENLSKAYRIGLKEQQHETMLGAFAAWAKSPLENFRSVRNLSKFDDVQSPSSPPGDSDFQLSSLTSHPSQKDIYWALRDVSFEVNQGESVGIIGSNGAGKSTLLKILSRITEPTAGRAMVYGRIASLLEVGTGFHPDLSGRENVYLNGTILGMKKREVDARFEEIVDFSGVEQFIDTPVKRYSSGMRVRLAFAVAAHLEPEILIVDEVLAVGDVGFQQKCLGKMNAVARSGRTVLFVSHQMAAIENLCTKAIIMEAGQIFSQGPTQDMVKVYLDNASQNPRHTPRRSDGIISSVEFSDSSDNPSTTFDPGQTFVIRIHLRSTPNMKNLSLGIGISDCNGLRITTLMTKFCAYSVPDLDSPRTVECVVEGLTLVSGKYSVKVTVGNQVYDLDSVENAGSFQINSCDFFKCGFLPSSTQGVVLARHCWRSSVQKD